MADEIHVFDNSEESSDGLPQARLVMRMRGNRIVEPSVEQIVLNAPDWAKPVIAAALQAATKPRTTGRGRVSRKALNRRASQGLFGSGSRAMEDLLTPASATPEIGEESAD